VLHADLGNAPRSVAALEDLAELADVLPSSEYQRWCDEVAKGLRLVERGPDGIIRTTLNFNWFE
jgi:hypothetical protein